MEISRIGQLQHYARTFDSGVRSLLSGCSDVQFVSTFFLARLGYIFVLIGYFFSSPSLLLPVQMGSSG